MKTSSMSFLLIVATSCCVIAFFSAQKSTSEAGTQFEEPVALMVGDEVMNQNSKMKYPSPAVFDVDNDGKDELVIGTIFGGIYACENSNQNDGDPVWEAPVAVNSVDGEPLDLHNW